MRNHNNTYKLLCQVTLTLSVVCATIGAGIGYVVCSGTGNDKYVGEYIAVGAAIGFAFPIALVFMLSMTTILCCRPHNANPNDENARLTGSTETASETYCSKIKKGCLSIFFKGSSSSVNHEYDKLKLPNIVTPY